MSYLHRLKSLETPSSTTDKTDENARPANIGSFVSTGRGGSEHHAPPALTPAEQQDIRDAVAERAAIQEYDGGLSRAQAQQTARGAMRVFRACVDMGPDRPAHWVTMLLPGCDLQAAAKAAAWQFPGRVLDLLEQTARGRP